MLYEDGKQYAGVLGDVDVNDSNFENERTIAFSTGDASLAKTRCSDTTSGMVDGQLHAGPILVFASANQSESTFFVFGFIGIDDL